MWRREIAWKRFDERGEERCGFACDGEICGCEGVGAVAINGSGLVFQYRIEADAGWHVRRVGVVSRLGAEEFTLMVERHEDGGWSVGGVRAPQFDRCDDLDLAFSPSTNVVAIKRLGLKVGGTGVSRAILVTEPELTVEAIEQVYRRIDERRFEYRAGAFESIISVDEDDVVVDYPGMFRAAVPVPG